MNKKIIKRIVEEFYSLDITTKTRERNYVEARAMYYKIVRDNTKLSLEVIGKSVNRNHATVLHGIKTLSNWIDTEIIIKARYILLKDQIEEIKSIASNRNLIKEVDQDLLLEYTNLNRRHQEVLKENISLAKDLNKLREEHSKREKFYSKYGYIN
jgi:predicted nuclease with TOPRIM domain